MRAWMPSVALVLLAGCFTRPATSVSQPIGSADDPPAQAVDINSMPADQRKSVLDWVDYICSLPPKKRAEAMKTAPDGYLLITGDPQQKAASDGPTMAFTCPP